MAPEVVQTSVQLPLAVVSPGDLGRLEREFAALDEQLLQLKLRAGGDAPKLPRTSKLLEELAAQNKLNLLQEADRQALKAGLERIQAHAPVLHISFSADPSPQFMDKLMTWLRREIHPQVLVTIGLQPNMGAGCMVRTTNKFFDMSLRADFAKQRDLLIEKLHQVAA